MAAVARDEDPAWVVDPDLLDLGVVEVALQRPEARHPGDELVDERLQVLHRSDGTGEAAPVVHLRDPLPEPTHRVGLVLGVDPGVAYEGTDLVGQRSDRHRPALPSAGRRTLRTACHRHERRRRAGHPDTVPPARVT